MAHVLEISPRLQAYRNTNSRAHLNSKKVSFSGLHPALVYKVCDLIRKDCRIELMLVREFRLGLREEILSDEILPHELPYSLSTYGWMRSEREVNEMKALWPA